MANDLESQLWRLRNLYQCREEGTGRGLPFKLRQEQEILAKHLIETPLVPAYIIKSRRLGISTFVDTFQADSAVFTQGWRGLIIDQKQDDATKKMVEIVRFAVDSLPPEILKDIVQTKRNDSELRLMLKGEPESRDSVIFATTGGRGGDCSMLHVSEWGPIAATDPTRSREIRTGTFPAARLGRRVSETTWYGGKSGDLWELVKPIMDGNPNAEGIIYFFPWHTDPQAVRFGGQVTSDIEEYFRSLAEKVGKTFTREQKLWYAAKKVEQGMWVKREYPSTLDEALSVPMAGTIYGEELDLMREQKRICEFKAETKYPACTFWDIGCSDYGCIWLVQFVGRDILILDYFSETGEPAATYAAKCREWELKYSIVIRKHYLPHDAEQRSKGTAKPYTHDLAVAGIRRQDIIVIPRTPDRWIGINHLKTMLPKCYIHSVNCALASENPGETIPSGIDCLDYYHRRVLTTDGMIYEEPVHDVYSNGADALRTMAEADRQGMIEGTSSSNKSPTSRPREILRAHTGHAPSSFTNRQRAVIR